MNSYSLEHLVGVFLLDKTLHCFKTTIGMESSILVGVFLLDKVLHFFKTTTGIEPSIFSFQKISALLVLCIFLKLCFACMF